MRSTASLPTPQAPPPDPLSLRPLIAAEIDRLRDELVEVVGARPLQRLLDTGEIGQYIGVTSQTVRRLRDEGMPHIRLGETYRYDINAVRQWLTSRGQP